MHPYSQNQKPAHVHSSSARASPACDTHNSSPQPLAVDSDRELQAAKHEASNLRVQLLLKEGEVDRLKQEQESLQEQNKVLKCQNAEIESENRRLTAALADAQSSNNKVQFQSFVLAHAPFHEQNPPQVCRTVDQEIFTNWGDKEHVCRADNISQAHLLYIGFDHNMEH
jgi:hypothetical protein